MPDRLALYPQEVRGAAIERAILDLEATAWDRTPAKPSPRRPKHTRPSFVLLEGKRAVCHVGIRRARLLRRGQSYAVCGLSEVVTHPLRRGQGLATALCCAPERAALYGRAGWEPSRRLPRGGNARGALSQRRSGTRDAGACSSPRAHGNMRRILRMRTSFWSWGEDSFGKKRAPALPILRKRGGALDFGEKGGITPPQTRGERSPSPPERVSLAVFRPADGVEGELARARS